VGHIEIIKEIGAGGTASVFLGIDLNTGFPVAVKMLWKNLFKTSEMKERFIMEANQYLYLKHPNIVSLRDFIIKEDAHYLVMEYIDGYNLDEYINKVSGPIPESKAIKMIMQVLDAVEFAHKRDVLHLDIKPANIMINKEGVIKLLDFGIATDSKKIIDGQIVGSPLYMSPEQTIGKNIDHQSDIYSLGITFFQMLTGSPPINGNTTKQELFNRIRKGSLPRAKEIYPFVADALQNILDKATNVDVLGRYKTVDDFAKDLRQL
jgi:serine/threonine protein kinase